jgi:hypothetical protein
MPRLSISVLFCINAARRRSSALDQIARPTSWERNDTDEAKRLLRNLAGPRGAPDVAANSREHDWGRRHAIGDTDC